jgi:hypothetical protein
VDFIFLEVLMKVCMFEIYSVVLFVIFCGSVCVILWFCL